MALVSVKVLFDESRCVSQGPFVMLGRVLASAVGRDSGAKLGDGVRLRDGRVRSGGSIKNWLTVIDEGTELVVHDVPEAMADTYVKGTRTKTGVRVEFMPSVAVADAAGLAAERERLAARILD